MAWSRRQNQSMNNFSIYEIKLLGILDKDWSDWLEGMTITHEGDVTVLRGPVLDQAALRGLLTQIWDLNRTVISVNRIPGL